MRRLLAEQGKLTPELALKVGMATGLAFKRGDYTHRVVIGKDTRRSGYMIENALTAGFTAVGMDVLLLGPMPTPAVAMLTRSMRADIGVMISASHNPFADNGIKLFRPDGYKLSDSSELEIEKLMDQDLGPRLARGQKIGRARRVEEARTRYVEYAKRRCIAMSISPACGGDRLRQRRVQDRPEVFGSWGPRSSIGVSPEGYNINEGASDRTGAVDRKGQEVAPISASRSMAMRTAC